MGSLVWTSYPLLQSLNLTVMYEVGQEVIYLDDELQRTGTIEAINYETNTVQITMLTGDLFICSIDKILYSLNY